MTSTMNASRRKTRSVSVTMNRYFEGYKVYLRKTNRTEVLTKWTKEHLKREIVNNLPIIVPNGDKLRVLGVGSGEGSQEIPQLQMLKAKYPNISADVVEPSKEMLVKYQNTVRKKCKEMDGIQHRWHNQTLQEFLKSKPNDDKYHFISIIHVIYFVGDIKESIKNLHNMLEDGGILFIVALSDKYDHISSFSLASEELESQGQICNAMAGLTIDPVTEYDINFSDIKTILDNLKMDYHLFEYTESTNISAMFAEEDSMEGYLLINFLSMTNDFRKLSEDFRNRVIKFYKDNSKIKLGDDGKTLHFIERMCDIFVLKKSTQIITDI